MNSKNATVDSAKSKTSNLMVRTISGLVMLSVLIACVKLGGLYFKSLLTLIGVAASWEWEHIFSGKKFGIMHLVNMAAVGFAIFNPLSIQISWIVIGAAFIVNLLYALFKVARPFLYSFGVIYASVPLLALNYVYDIKGWIGVLFIFAITISSDTGGYVFGLTIGGPKLAPKISPKKSWAGFLGGIVTSFLVCAAIPLSMFVLSRHDTLDMIVPIAFLGAGLSIVSQVGDLFESYVKRQNGRADVKDSSHLIPGHGGVLDRLDSLFFVAPAVALLVICFVDKM